MIQKALQAGCCYINLDLTMNIYDFLMDLDSVKK